MGIRDVRPDEREETVLPKRCGQIGGLSSLGLRKFDLAL